MDDFLEHDDEDEINAEILSPIIMTLADAMHLLGLSRLVIEIEGDDVRIET